MADYRVTIDEIFEEGREEKRQYLAAPKGKRPTIAPAKPFANPSHEHAGQVITKLVRETEHELLILSRKLSSGGHSALRMEAHLSRHPDVQIRVLVESAPSGPIFPNGEINWRALRESALIDLAANFAAAGKKVISLDGEPMPGLIAVRVLPIESPVHFIVSDEFAFRIEKDHDIGSATVSAKDPETASKLAEKFNSFWNLSIPARWPLPQSRAA